MLTSRTIVRNNVELTLILYRKRDTVFKKSIFLFYLQPYDFQSVMHYDKYSAGTGGAIMENKNDPSMELGNEIGMTPTDIAEVLAVYG